MSDCDVNDSIYLSENQRYNCPIYVVYVRIKLQFSSYKMFMVKGTSLISSHQYSVHHFYKLSFLSLFYFHSFLVDFISVFFSSLQFFILHFYTSTAVDTCSLRLPIFTLFY